MFRAGALSLLLALAACDRAAPEAVAAPEAATTSLKKAKIAASTYRPTVEITGTLDPIAAVHLGFDVPGRVERLAARRGDVVRAGQALASLDDTIAQAQLAQAKAGRSAATAQAEAAEATWGRLEKMGDAISGQDRTQAEAGLKAARAQLEQAEGAVRMAEANVRFHTLKAPIDGVVTNAPDNVGALVGAGSPLFVIEDLSALRLKGSVPETVTWVDAHAHVHLFAATPGADAPVAARVDRVLPSLDPATRRLPVEIIVESPPPHLLAHALGRAVVSGGVERPAWLIPAGALVTRPEFGVLIDGSPPRFVAVEVIERKGAQALVAGALSEGTEVVVDPPHGYGE